MAIREHPAMGTILLCDFGCGFVPPEMVKRRPVIVVSPKIAARPNLCTIVPLSTEPPRKQMPYHVELPDIRPPLPAPWDKGPNWVKGDMIYSVSFERLDLIRMGKTADGTRLYRYALLDTAQLRAVRACVLNALGLGGLTKHL
jgi:mRNA interferase MazF